MRIGVVISTNDAETCWNALRYANYSLAQGDAVSVFFMGKGVEYQKISEKGFNTIAEAEKLVEAGGKIYACGTCMRSREQEGSEMCPLSTMKDMYEIVRDSDRVVTF